MKYVIPFKGLKIGKHHFTFELDPLFFEQFDSSEIKRGKCAIEVTLYKNQDMMELSFKLKGYVEVTCDRCLEPFDLPFQISESLYVKFSEEGNGQTDDLLILSEKEHELDITQNIYEYIILHLPYQRIHPEDKFGNSMCNKEMILHLNEYLTDHEAKEDTDPRWEQLRSLLNNN